MLIPRDKVLLRGGPFGGLVAPEGNPAKGIGFVTGRKTAAWRDDDRDARRVALAEDGGFRYERLDPVTGEWAVDYKCETYRYFPTGETEMASGRMYEVWRYDGGDD